MFHYKSYSPQVKRNLTCFLTNLVYRLPRELPKNLRPGILGDWKNLKFVWRHSAQTSFKKLNLGSSRSKIRKNRDQTFLVAPNFTGLPYFVPNILSGIVDWRCRKRH